MKIIIRKYLPENDEGFVYNSWLKSCRKNGDFTRMPNMVFYSNYKDLIQRALETSEILIACVEGDESQILGYLIAQERVLQFAYTKYTYRKLGVFSKLFKTHFKTFPVFTTHSSDVIVNISEKYNIVYNPFLFWRN